MSDIRTAAICFFSCFLAVIAVILSLGTISCFKSSVTASPQALLPAATSYDEYHANYDCLTDGEAERKLGTGVWQATGYALFGDTVEVFVTRSALEMSEGEKALGLLPQVFCFRKPISAFSGMTFHREITMRDGSIHPVQ